jgi:hypothetical protein
MSLYPFLLNMYFLILDFKKNLIDMRLVPPFLKVEKNELKTFC